MKAPILVGNSLGSESDGVLGVSLQLARGIKAPLHVVHAFEPPVPVGPPEEAWVLQREIDERLQQELQDCLGRQGKRLGLAEVAGSRSELCVGSPFRVLEETALKDRAGMLVVGAAVDGVRMWRFLGSTADRLLRKVVCPVMVVQPGSVFPPRRVLFAVDLSPLAAGALRRGAALLRAVGARPDWTEVVFVLDEVDARSMTQFTPEQVAQFASERLHLFVAEHGALLPPEARSKVLVGAPRESLLAHIAVERPDLVILGTHGRSGLDRLLLGSVTAAVLRECPCSTLVVTPEAAQAALDRRDDSADWHFVADDA